MPLLFKSNAIMASRNEFQEHFQTFINPDLKLLSAEKRKLSVNETVIAKWEEDSVWYRGVITDVQGTMYSVRLVILFFS